MDLPMPPLISNFILIGNSISCCYVVLFIDQHNEIKWLDHCTKYCILPGNLYKPAKNLIAIKLYIDEKFHIL